MEIFFILVVAIVIAAFLAFFARTRPTQRTVIVERDPIESDVVERPAGRRVAETERTYESRY